MQTKALTCPRCASRHIKKNGISPQQKQKYRCQACARQFITDYTYRGCQGAIPTQVVSLTLNGAGVRDSQRILQISRGKVLKSLRQAAQRLKRPPLPARLTEVQIDEMWSFIGSRKQACWLWYAFDPKTHRVVAWTLGARTDQVCRRLLRQLKDCQVLRFCTDAWESYQKLISPAQHWIGKQFTQHIERHNLNFRTRLKRLQRKTICFSKSEHLHRAVLKLFIHHWNLDQHSF